MTTLEKIRTLHRAHPGDARAMLIVLPVCATLFLALAVVLP